ncbi:MAG: YegS/Rv2252/BmrU family lipid kinase [Lachnospiraceae bacterium]|nr:YegS/Rv2252/BmrU family lipid kinase [Lachnospiraceae bacterium]
MRKRLVFIYNPNAGKARLKSKLADVIRIFAEHDYEVVAVPTFKHGDATDYAREYALEGGCERIVCSGGDGTLNEVATGVCMAGVRVPIGFIPAGTTNDFSYSLKIPKNIFKAAEMAATQQPVPSDIGEINGEFFTYTAAFGLFTDVSYDTPQNFKNVLGRMAYLLSGASKLYNIKSYHLTVEYMEQQVQPEEGSETATEMAVAEADAVAEAEPKRSVVYGEFIYGMIANSDSVGGFKGITGKGVRFDDGVFEMILIRKPHNILEMTNIVNELLNKKLNSDNIVYAKVNYVRLQSEEDLPWSLDGEFGGNMPRAEIHIRKQAVDYIRLP